MSRPNDISQEAWDASNVYVREWANGPGTIRHVVARAIMAAKAEEREACELAALGPSAGFDFQQALAECRDLEAGTHGGRIAAAAAIRKRANVNAAHTFKNRGA